MDTDMKEGSAEEPGFAIGDMVYCVDQNCWGNHSTYIHFGKVKKITRAGRFNVDIFENIPHPEHEKTKYYPMEESHTVVTPGEKIVDSVILNADGTVRGKNFGTGGYMTFEKYLPTMTLMENIDLGEIGRASCRERV